MRTQSTTNPRLAELRERAAAGDTFAAAAVRAYRTDAELERAERTSAAQDYTDGGGPVDEHGRRLDECEGHPAGAFDPMGETVYCDGSCRR